MSAAKISAKGSGKSRQTEARDFKLNAPSIVELPHNPADVALVDRVGSQLYLQFITRYLHWSGQLRCRVTTLTRFWTDGGNSADLLSQIANGGHAFAATLKNAKKPMIIVGMGALARADGAAILAAARKADVPADAVVEVGAATPQFSGRLRDWADSIG